MRHLSYSSLLRLSLLSLIALLFLGIFTGCTEAEPPAERDPNAPLGGGGAVIYGVGRDAEGFDLYLTSQTGAELTKFTDDRYTFWYFGDWSPDGSMMIGPCYNGMEGSFWKASADGSRLEIFMESSPERGIYYVSYSPDGSQILYSAGPEGGPYDFYMADVDGSNEILLGGGFEIPRRGDWGPEGIVYNGTYDGVTDIYLIDPATGEYSLLFETDHYDSFPEWSQDGLMILWEDTDEDWLLVGDPDDGTYEQHYKGGFHSWAPDGGIVFFERSTRQFVYTDELRGALTPLAEITPELLAAVEDVNRGGFFCQP